MRAAAAIGFLQSKVERALALFGRRPPQRVESIVIPASETCTETAVGQHWSYRSRVTEIALV
jgi:hypothetical protein